jgi:hypothetical protein
MPDLSTQRNLLAAISAAEAHGFGLSIQVGLDAAGQAAVFFIEALPAQDRRDDPGLDESANEDCFSRFP